MVPGVEAYFAISYRFNQWLKVLFVEKLLMFGSGDRGSTGGLT